MKGDFVEDDQDPVSSQVVCVSTVAQTQSENPFKFQQLSQYSTAINCILRENNYDEYTERTIFIQPVCIRCNQHSFPLAWITYLQRLYAINVLKQNQLKNIESYMNIYDDENESVEKALEFMDSSHLLYHANEGFYVPVLFQGPPIFDPDARIPGGWLGSSIRLMEELVEVTPLLGINLSPLEGMIPRGGGYDICKSSIDELNNASKDLHGKHSREKIAWFAMYECARVSILDSTAMVIY